MLVPFKLIHFRLGQTDLLSSNTKTGSRVPLNNACLVYDAATIMSFDRCQCCACQKKAIVMLERFLRLNQLNFSSQSDFHFLFPSIFRSLNKSLLAPSGPTVCAENLQMNFHPEGLDTRKFAQILNSNKFTRKIYSCLCPSYLYVKTVT